MNYKWNEKKNKQLSVFLYINNACLQFQMLKLIIIKNDYNNNSSLH